MAYHGVKFKAKLIDKEIPKHKRLKELKYWCKKFHDYSLAPAYKGGSYGNLSFRVKKNSEEFVITGSKIGLKDFLPDRCFAMVSNVDLKKSIVYYHGMKKPSSESMLHFAIYRKRKDVNAIFHGHSNEILRFASRLNLCQTDKKEPYGTLKLVKGVLEKLGKKNFIIIKDHGFISMSKDLKNAGNLAIKAYNNAYNCLIVQ